MFSFTSISRQNTLPRPKRSTSSYQRRWILIYPQSTGQDVKKQQKKVKTCFMWTAYCKSSYPSWSLLWNYFITLGGATSGHTFGTWSIPPVIADEESFRLQSTGKSPFLGTWPNIVYLAQKSELHGKSKRKSESELLSSSSSSSTRK